jgi:hypothetical protein
MWSSSFKVRGGMTERGKWFTIPLKEAARAEQGVIWKFGFF